MAAGGRGCRRAVVGLLAILALAPLAAPLRAQSPAPAGRLCLLSLDELRELTGLEFVSAASGPTNCTYDSDPALDLFTIDLRVEGPDPTAVDPPEDGLWLVRINEEGGRDVTVGGFPAWQSENGIWVDTGDDLFVVQPILFFATAPPAPEAFLASVAELALSRLASGGDATGPG
jgi:hypothetical protein